MSRKCILLILSLIIGCAIATPAQNQEQQPLVLPLSCDSGDCPILKGAPQTKGMRSGYVRLRPGASVGWHSTEGNEEQLIILRGKGEAHVAGGADKSFAAPCLVYFGPATRHNVSNAGTEILEYVYVVAPTRQ